MLYDPKWKKTKADPFTLSAFIAWLEKQPADGEYHWLSCDSCVVAEYLKSTGSHNPAGDFDYGTVFGASWPYYGIARAHPHTFGAALERARALTEG